MITALAFLHSNNIVFRDLKPENIVLDKDGHAKLTDFGLSKEEVTEGTRNNSFVGSVAYMAPEILNRKGHTKTVDWYLVGVLLYEMIVGIPPYYDDDEDKLFENIKKGPLIVPEFMSSPARDFIFKLLNRNPKKRLGASERDADELREHPFFKGVDWEKVENLEVEMPKLDIHIPPYDPECEKAFRVGEQQSHEDMIEIYKKLKKGSFKGKRDFQDKHNG